MNSADLRRLREIDCVFAHSPHCAITRNGSLVAVVGHHGYLFVENGVSVSTPRLTDGIFKAASFYGDDEDKLVCLARHTLALVNVETRVPITWIQGATSTLQKCQLNSPRFSSFRICECCDHKFAWHLRKTRANSLSEAVWDGFSPIV
jgi:hypothetical protein